MTAPYWPAMMLRKTAAAYCELSEAAFEREVSSGTLPLPVILGGKPHWHREQIEMARRVGDRENDEAVEALVRESNMIEGITSTTSRHYSAG